jgi:hypothetical protein
MKRHDFLTMAAGSGVVVFARKALGVGLDAATGKCRIDCIRQQIPAVSIPPYHGTSCVDHVHDTHDLAQRGRLALNVLTSITNPDTDYEIYFHLRVFSNPPANVNHWLRNQFAETQLIDTAWIYELARTQDMLSIFSNESADRPADRNAGGFGGWCGFNDWMVHHKDHSFGTMHCCTGTCSRSIYYAWEKMLAYNDGALKFHLLMNRVSPWADVYNHGAPTSRSSTRSKLPRSAFPSRSRRRPPKSLTPSTESSGRYIQVTALKPGGRVQINFPIRERTVKLTVMRVDYTVIVRGSTVVSIDPPGQYQPYYQRAMMRQEQVPLREVRDPTRSS